MMQLAMHKFFTGSLLLAIYIRIVYTWESWIVLPSDRPLGESQSAFDHDLNAALEGLLGFTRVSHIASDVFRKIIFWRVLIEPAEVNRVRTIPGVSITSSNNKPRSQICLRFVQWSDLSHLPRITISCKNPQIILLKITHYNALYSINSMPRQT